MGVVFDSLGNAGITQLAGIWDGGRGPLGVDAFALEKLGPDNVSRRSG